MRWVEEKVELLGETWIEITCGCGAIICAMHLSERESGIRNLKLYARCFACGAPCLMEPGDERGPMGKEESHERT